LLPGEFKRQGKNPSGDGNEWQNIARRSTDRAKQIPHNTGKQEI
jgi:hypothetical protein